MMGYSLKAFIYFLGWVVAWVLFSTLINAGFLAINLYVEGGKGKLITFIVSGIISIAGASSLYREVFTNDQ